MSGLIGSILNTTASLKSNQKAIEVAGKNMANVNNANYSRQRLEFGISGGISVSTITQIRDNLLDEKLIREGSVSGNLTAQNEVYKQIQVILGEQITADVSSPDTLQGSSSGDQSGSGLSYALDNFFNSLQALSVDPTDAGAKASVIANAEVLVERFNSISNDLTELDNDVLDNVETEVRNVNNLLGEIADINAEIAKIELRDPGGAFEYRDLRQQKLEELSTLIDFETVNADNGQVILVAPDKAGNSIVLLDRGVVRNEIKFNEASNEIYFSDHTSLPLGSSPNADAYDLGGGKIGGYLYARSTTDPFGGASSYAVGPLAKAREDLDQLAVRVATEVSAIYDRTDYGASPQVLELFFDDDAVPDPIDLSNVTAANIRLYQGDLTTRYGDGPAFTDLGAGSGTVKQPLNVNTLKSTNTTNSGSNEIALALAELNSQTYSDLQGSTFTGFVADMASDIGYAVSSNQQLIENQQLILAQLKDERASVSGVSIDEELANIVRYQRSFEASARVLQVMDELLELITTQLVR